MTSPAPAPLGAIAHYNLLERLEPAGPGELYRARDTRLGRTVAVRVLPASFVPDPASRAALIARARTVSSLSHPNVIALFDVGEDGGRVYFVFEFLSGQSLRAQMAGRPMNVRRAVEVAIQITDAIADTHAAGFVHGGLSPDSVIVTARGHAKVPAFELAARAGFEAGGGDARLRDYDSPEEARGQTPDERSDVYSIGAILYEMLTTRRPSHRGASAPSASNPHVPQALDAVVLKAVAPNPEARYQNVVTLAAELRGVLASFESRTAAETPPRGHGASAGRVIALALAMLAAIAFVLWWFVGVG